MNEERTYYLTRYEKERDDEENTIKNAELCDQFSKNSSDDKDLIFWKKKGLDIREKIYGKKSCVLGSHYDSMAELYLNCGKYKLAKSMGEKALSVKSADETGQSTLLETYAIMALNYLSMDDNESAIELGEKALNIGQAKHQDDYSEMVTINKYMAWAYSYQDNEEQRDDRINQALDMAIEHFGEDSAQAAEMYIEKANFMLEEKDDKLEMLKRAMIILVEHFGIEDNRVGKAYRLIWQCWKDSPDCIQIANDWLKENVPEHLYDELQKWRKRNGG